MNSKFSSLIFVVVLGILDGALGHGNMIDPLNRGSLWRLDSSKAIDYNDLDGNYKKVFKIFQLIIYW